MKKLLLPLLLISLIACKKEVNKPVDNKVDSTAQERSDSTNTTNQSTASKAEVLKKVNDEILQVLKNKNYKKLAEYIHPEKGVRFSMYAFVNPKEDKTFSKADFEKYQPKHSQLLLYWSVFQLFATLLLVSYFFSNIASIGLSNMFIYGFFVFVSIYSYTELMDTKVTAVYWEGLRLMFGIGILINYSDWFGLSNTIALSNVLIVLYLIGSFGMSIYFTRFEFRKTNVSVTTKPL